MKKIVFGVLMVAVVASLVFAGCAAPAAPAQPDPVAVPSKPAEAIAPDPIVVEKVVETLSYESDVSIDEMSKDELEEYETW